MQVISAQGNRYNVFGGTCSTGKTHVTVRKSSMRSFFSHSLTESGDRERIVVRLACCNHCYSSCVFCKSYA